jgi:hypothetical protein
MQASSRGGVRDADALAREASDEHVAGGEVACDDLGDIPSQNNARPRSSERGLAEGVLLDLVDGVSDSSPFESKFDSADPGETRADS